MILRGLEDASLGALDTPNQLTPAYELWSIRHETWPSSFAPKHSYERVSCFEA